MTCDPEGGFNKGAHAKEHTLLHVRRTREEDQEAEEENKILSAVSALETKMEDKLAPLESRFNSLDEMVDSLDTKLAERVDYMDRTNDQRMKTIDQRMKSMEDRFTKIESLLERLVPDRSVADK